jgi:hypothetical protein
VKRRFTAPSKERLYRLGFGVPLNAAAVLAGISLTRASQIERDPGAAKAGELEALRAAVEQLVADREEPQGADAAALTTALHGEDAP